MTLETKQGCPQYPANWNVQFLCDCRKCSPNIHIHQGVAHEISACGVNLLSNHNICQQHEVAMLLTIPAVLNGAQKKSIKIIGQSLSTVDKDGSFLTRIEFLHFEKDGKKILESNLLQHFQAKLSAPEGYLSSPS